MRRKRVVIVGGGTSGWMGAAALARLLGPVAAVHVIESADIPAIGVGEATLPHLRLFIRRLGLDEDEFMAATLATYKLGISFTGFGAEATSYFHPFGTHGEPLHGVAFHHFWLRAALHGTAGPIDGYSLPALAAAARRFEPSGDGDGSAARYGYAYQLDSTRFGPFLREFAMRHGVERTEATVGAVQLDGETGDVEHLVLEDGRRVEGDIFVDCSGFRSLLLGEALGEPWIDWARWLPCDRAAAMTSERPPGPVAPYTDAIAMPAGWRWRIPLQHRVGNGYVFASQHLSDDEACAAIAGCVEAVPLSDPRILRFRAGRRQRSWARNVVAIGLASGFLEPLESTSLYLVQMAITLLVELFPTGRITDQERTEFNRAVDMEYERARDFLILHYHATRRRDAPLWDHVRTMEIPETLAGKIELWKRTARVEHYSEGLFFEPSWVSVYLGQGMIPNSYDPRADIPEPDALQRALDRLQRAYRDDVARMPDHFDFLGRKGDRVAAS